MLGRIFTVESFLGEKKATSCDPEKAPGIHFCEGNARGTENALLIGPPSSGKTSLLFQLALSFADAGKQVLFICPRKFTKLPLLLEGRSQPPSLTLGRIQIVYLETREEYLNYMASIHCNAAGNFHAIVVDDIDSYFTGLTRNQELPVAARIFAYAVDALNFQLQKLGESCHCVLAVSMTSPSDGQGIPHCMVYERWMHHVWPIKVSDTHSKGFTLSAFEPQRHAGLPLAEVTYKLMEKTFAVQEVKQEPCVESQEKLSNSS